MLRSSSHCWWRALLLLPLTGVVATTCDTYSVELRASFENDAVESCSADQIAIVEALIHSLVQTDAIVGLNRMIPVPPFFLAYEELGPNSTQSRTFGLMTDSNNGTQMERAQDYLTVEDELEELYYSATGTLSRDEVEGEVDYKGEEELPKEAPPIKLTPPDPIALAEGSLRSFPGNNNNKHKRNLRLRTIEYTSSPTVSHSTDSPSDVPSRTPTQAPSEIPSYAPSNSPSHSPSATPTSTASDVPSTAPSQTPSTPPSASPSNAPSSHPSESPTVTASDTPSQAPSKAPSQAPSGIPSNRPSTTPSSTPTENLDCLDADWCAWFLTRPCDNLPHDPIEEAQLNAFQERVATQIERKLRKWARDTNTNCLGNSWEIKAAVQRLL